MMNRKDKKPKWKLPKDRNGNTRYSYDTNKVIPVHQQQVKETITEAYERGFRDGYNRGYKRGQEHAKKSADNFFKRAFEAK